MSKFTEFFAGVLLLASVNVNASEFRKQSDAVLNDVPKGMFVERNDVSVSVNSETLVKEWNAEELYNEWNVKGFNLAKTNGRIYLSSGKYNSSTTYFAESGEIKLPTVAKSELLFVQLDHMVDVETYYDEVAVYVQSETDSCSRKVYAFSGTLKKGVETSFDISKFAGQKVRFSLELTSDNTEAGKGWDIASFSILSGDTHMSKSTNRSELRSTKVELNLYNVTVNTDGTGSAYVYFENEDTYNKYKSQESDLEMTVNGTTVGNLRFSKESDLQDVNIVYAIDNSGSMSAYQEKVRNSVPELVTYSTDLFNSYATLFRFGQGSTGCSVNEEIRFGITTFNLADENDQYVFCGDENEESIWSRNVQSGSVEQYYAVLKKVATTPFTKVEDKLFVIVLMGDEPMFRGDNNNGDCDGGTAGFSLLKQNGLEDQQSVAEFLKEKGATVFVIQESSNRYEYETIVRETGGDFVEISNSDYLEIADKINAKMKNRYRVDFSTDKYKCGQSVLINAQWNDATGSTIVNVKGSVSVKRDTETEKLGNVNVGEPVTLTFLVSQEENCATASNAVLRYVYNDKDVLVENLEIDDNGQFSYTIPAEHVKGEKILYNVLLDVIENDIKIGNPYVTHADWAWEFGILNDRPLFEEPILDNYAACSERTMTANIIDGDGISSAKLYYKSTLESGFRGPLSMEFNEAKKVFSAKLDETVGDANGFYFYIVAEDKRGLEANYGEASNPKFMKFEEPKISDKNIKATIEFLINRRQGCAPLKSGDFGTFHFFVKNDCGDEVLLSKIKVEGNDEQYVPYDIILPQQTETSEKNGFSEDDDVIIRFSYNDEDRIYDLNSDVKIKEDLKLSVCIPEIIDEFTMLSSKVTSLRFAGIGDTVKYGDTLTFGNVGEPSIIRFNIPNDHYSPLILNNILIDDKSGCFTIDGDIENRLINPEMTGEFGIVYTPIADQVSQVIIYNNTRKQNPFIFYIKGDVDKKALCKKLCPSVAIYNDNFVTQINTLKHESEVTLAVKDRLGNTINTTSMIMGGPATQSLSVSSANMDKDKEYLLSVKVDEYICDNAFVFNEKSVTQFDSTAVDNCHDLIKNLNVNSWGTMVEVSVLEPTESMLLEIFTLSGIKTDVHFGPQLMGGPTTHNLYLNTNSLPSGAYVLKARVGNKICSQMFINVK